MMTHTDIYGLSVCNTILVEKVPNRGARNLKLWINVQVNRIWLSPARGQQHTDHEYRNNVLHFDLSGLTGIRPNVGLG